MFRELMQHPVADFMSDRLSLSKSFSLLPRYFPKRTKGTSEKVRLYPENHHQRHRRKQHVLPTRLPAIKFDHPVRGAGADIGRSPVLPPSQTRYDVDVQGFVNQ